MTAADLVDVDAYAPDEPRPLGSFLGLVGAYGGLAGGLATVAVRRGLPERIPVSDVVLLGVATAKLSRLLARDRVTSPFRAPFTTFEGYAGASEVEESPRGTGLRKALGELLTCPYCLAQWVGTGLLGGLLVRPRETRATAALLAALTVSDVVQAGHDRLAGSET